MQVNNFFLDDACHPSSSPEAVTSWVRHKSERDVTRKRSIAQIPAGIHAEVAELNKIYRMYISITAVASSHTIIFNHLLIYVSLQPLALAGRKVVVETHPLRCVGTGLTVLEF